MREEPNRMARVYVDLETAPGDPTFWRTREVVARAVAKGSPIAAAHEATALDPTAGVFVAVAWALDEDEPVVAYVPEQPGTTLQAQEWGALERMAEALDNVGVISWVAHNGLGFDLPWLSRRGAMLGSRLASRVPRDSFGKSVEDTARMWAGTERHNYEKLGNLCRLLGLPGKGAVTGDQVWRLVVAGEHARVKRYAANDVRRLRSVHRRLCGLAALPQDVEAVRAEVMEVS
jgi:hypothetical protein